MRGTVVDKWMSAGFDQERLGAGNFMFGTKKRVQELESHLARANGILQLAGAEDATAIASALEELKAQRRQIREDIDASRHELADLQRAVVETREVALLQEAAIYEYRHPLDDAVAYRSELAALRDRVKTEVKAGRAVVAATTWEVNGSASQGRKMISDFSKLLLRAYNNEVDNLVRTMKPHKLASSVDRLLKTRETIARLGKTMNLAITDAYHDLRVRELELTADYLAMAADEKERAREERERLREEEMALREFKREEERLEKERKHRQSVLDQLEASAANPDEIELARAALNEVQSALEGVLAREANIRAGYVYVISNIGSFGPGIVKIGMTRRLAPMDRINELGDASVPFRFDIHALVFSDDAVGLEGKLHQSLADRRVNLVNQRREYFYASPEEVRVILETCHGQLLEFEDEPQALEWYQSETVRKASSHYQPNP